MGKPLTLRGAIRQKMKLRNKQTRSGRAFDSEKTKKSLPTVTRQTFAAAVK